MLKHASKSCEFMVSGLSTLISYEAEGVFPWNRSAVAGRNCLVKIGRLNAFSDSTVPALPIFVSGIAGIPELRGLE